MKKEQRWEMRYVVVSALGQEIEKVCHPRSEEQKQKNIDTCKRVGYKIVSVEKMYPFNTYKNQHNFELIANICFNRMHDMEIGDVAYDNDEYIRLEDMKRKAEKFFCAELPIAWFTWDDWKEAKELSEMAILHRQDACIEAGRPDLVPYC